MGNFYGKESVTPKIQALYDDLTKVWSIETCSPGFRDRWSMENQTLGQCSITAFLVQDILGGKVYGMEMPDGSIHCYNEADGMVFDLTSAQFGDAKLNYEGNPEQSREEHFKNEDKHQRYLLLKQKYEELNA